MDSQQKSLVLRVLIDLLLLFTVFLPYIVIKSALSPFTRGFFCNDESLAHPYHDSTIPSAALATLGICFNIATFTATESVLAYMEKKESGSVKYAAVGQWRVPKFLVTCYQLTLVFLFGEAAEQSTYNIMKYSVGRLRPHFYDICQPDWSRINCTDSQGHNRYITEDVCTGTDAQRMTEMRLSFPSGHASMAFYYATFLIMYLQARLTWKGSDLLKHFLSAVSLYIAIYVAVSRISDYKHHWSDVLFGALLGTVIAVLTALYVGRLFANVKLKAVSKDLHEVLQDYYNKRTDNASFTMVPADSTNGLKNRSTPDSQQGRV